MSSSVSPLTVLPHIGPARHKGSRGMWRLALVASVCLSAGGCSLTFPIMGLATVDEEPTGSIVRPASPLSPALDAEDWRRASAAMGVAVDPQGSGTRVAWDNPQSGAKGAFVPTGRPYVRNGQICRPFTADLDVSGGHQRVDAVACRDTGADWTVGDVRRAS